MNLLAVVVAVFLIFVVAPTVLVLLTVRRFRRLNRVSPRVVTFAPTMWLWHPERPARLHRRLRRATAMARAGAAIHAKSWGRGRGLTTIPDLVDDLERRACTVDSRLVLASRARGPARWSMLNELEHDVREVEGLSTRLVGLTTEWATVANAGMPERGSADAIGQRLDALEEAMREVGAIAGHTQPDRQPNRLRRLG